jgi:hypothetical protein
MYHVNKYRSEWHTPSFTYYTTVGIDVIHLLLFNTSWYQQLGESLMSAPFEKLPDVPIHTDTIPVHEEEDAHQRSFGGRCEHCTAPLGVICEFPHESPDCPIHAGHA